MIRLILTTHTHNLTLNSKYTLIKTKGDMVKIMNDLGNYSWYKRYRFKEQRKDN